MFDSGGKAQAPTIHHDAEWGAIKEQLAQTKRNIDNVSVVFELDILERFRPTRKRVRI